MPHKKEFHRGNFVVPGGTPGAWSSTLSTYSGSVLSQHAMGSIHIHGSYSLVATCSNPGSFQKSQTLPAGWHFKWAGSQSACIRRLTRSLHTVLDADFFH